MQSVYLHYIYSFPCRAKVPSNFIMEIHVSVQDSLDRILPLDPAMVGAPE